MTCRDTEEDEPMTDSATEQAPLDVPVPPERNPMRDPGNRLKLAVFCANVARGTSMSEAETLPKVTWEESQRLALAADRAGIDGMIPLGRWKATARGGGGGRPDVRALGVGVRAVGADRADQRLHDGEHAAVPPARRRADDVDDRPRLRRALLAERRRGLQRAGVQDARPRGPVARGPLRARRGVDDDHPSRVDGGGAVRLRRRLPHGRARSSPSPSRCSSRRRRS